MALLGAGVLAAPAASITVSAIPATASHLYVVYQVRSAVAAETVGFGRLQLNGDTAANYGRENVNGTNTSAGAGNSTGSVAFCDLIYEAGPSATANVFGAGVVIIPYYSSTTQVKTLVGHGGILPVIGTTSNWIAGAVSGYWNSTAAVNAIKVMASDGASNLATGSSVKVYGIT